MQRKKTWAALTVAVSTAVSAAALLVGGVSSADAAPGARGGINFKHIYCSPADEGACAPTYPQSARGTSGLAAMRSSDGYTQEYTLGGWAYNARTVPVQAYEIKFYSVWNNVLYTTGQHLANLSDPTDAKKIHAATKDIGWHYRTGYHAQAWHDQDEWFDACLFVHDKGESGGWVKASCVS